MDGEAGWWTTSGNIGLPPLARALGVGRQQQHVPMRQYKDYLSLSEEELNALHEKTGYTFIIIYYIKCILYTKDNMTLRE